MTIVEQCVRQAGWCEALGSPLYTHLLNRVALDYEQAGPTRTLLEPHANDPSGSLLPLRLMGAVHRLVLEGQAQALAPFYPSVGGQSDPEKTWEPFRDLLEAKAPELRRSLPMGVQTNDVGRSGTLLGGFLEVAKTFGLPLRLLELGASGGLNLLWDRYRYEWAGGSWGNAASRVRLENVFLSTPPDFPSEVTIAERAACDKNPLDPTSEAGQLTLLSFIWADQVERIARLRAACEMAKEVSFSVDQSSAGPWLKERLRTPRPGMSTVVFHSVVWNYLAPEEQEQIRKTIEDAGARANREAPLAWLSMEAENLAAGGKPQLRLQMFPGGEERTLATSSFHAPEVRWLEDTSI